MQSMTGFGKAEGVIGNLSLSIEIKSVNHRFLDVRFRLPSALSAFEATLSEKLRKSFERGSLDIHIKLKGSGSIQSTRFTVDRRAAESLIESAETLRKEFKLAEKPTLEFLATTNRVFVPLEEVEDTTALLEPLAALFQEATRSLAEMRKKEGQHLRKALEKEIQTLSSVTRELTALSTTHTQAIRERLTHRIAQWKLSEPDAQRLEWEVAFYAERSDITEELARLEAHLVEFKKILENAQAIGKRLDFLTQELHREMNTIASKADLLPLTQLTLEGKAAIEKLREQIQNVE